MPDINPGIRLTVGMLNAAGHKTTDSGDGETRDFTCDREKPYVVVVSTPERLVQEAQEIVQLLKANGILVSPIGDDEAGGVQIQATYDPSMGQEHGAALIDLSGIHDRMLPPVIIFMGPCVPFCTGS